VLYRTDRRSKQADAATFRGTMGISLTELVFLALPALFAA
jgi:hypothetical protein